MIETRSVTKRLGDKNVLTEVTLSAADGEVTGFVGPNGVIWLRDLLREQAVMQSLSTSPTVGAVPDALKGLAVLVGWVAVTGIGAWTRFAHEGLNA